MGKLPQDSWDDKAQSRNELLINVDDEKLVQASKSAKVGNIGDAARFSEVNGQPNPRFEKGFLYEQSSDNSDTSFIIGPVKLTYSVQDVKIVESRAIQSPKTTRSDRPLLVDTGTTEQKATVNFIFSGTEDINTFARSIIALFKVCPIISVKNEMLSDSWSVATPALEKVLGELLKKKSDVLKQTDINAVYADVKAALRDGTFGANYFDNVRSILSDDKSKEQIEEVLFDLFQYKISSRYIPVTLEEINIRTVPDIPNTILMSLTIGRVDVSSSTERGLLEYQQFQPGSPSVLPTRAYWLKKWLYRLVETDSAYLPKIDMAGDRDFDKFHITFFSKTVSDVLPLKSIPFGEEGIVLSAGNNEGSQVLAQSASMYNHFAYQRLVGKPAPCAQHMGSSARYLSADFQFHDDDKMFEKISRFKEWSDYIMRSEAIIDRVMGWEVRCVTTKLLGGSTADPQRTKFGVYAAVNSQSSTSDIPHVKQASINFHESNTNFHKDYQILLEEGGIELKKLKEFFLGKEFNGTIYGIVPLDERFRKLDIDTKRRALYRLDHTKDAEYNAFTVLWPTGNKLLLGTINPAINGVINRDTLRAALLDRKYNFGTELIRALVKTPLASGVIKQHGEYGFWDKIKAAYNNNTFAFNTPAIDSSEIANAKEAIIRAVDGMFAIRVPEGEERDRLISLIAGALFGSTYAADAAIKMIASSNYSLSYNYREALFNVLTKRPKAPANIPHVYKSEGLYSGFQKLYYEYILSSEIYPGFKDSYILNDPRRSDNTWRGPCFKDYWLPTYNELFGSDWPAYAPTYDDVGIPAPFDRRDANRISSDTDVQQTIVARYDDVVPPYVWFYHRKTKQKIRSMLNSAGDSFLDLADKRYLTLNLKSSRLSGLDKADRRDDLEELINSKNTSAVVNSTKKSLVDAIIDSYTDKDTRLFNSKKFDEDLRRTKDLRGDENDSYLNYYLKYHDENSPSRIALYFSVVAADKNSLGGYVTTRKQTSPLFGAAWIKVMHDEQVTIKATANVPATLSTHDEALITEDGLTNDAFLRNLRDNTKLTVHKSLNQVSDDYYSMSKLWPTAKVYFIDRRGEDIIADDVFFSTDSVISIDVTLDKEDAALAVIRIADPLRHVQMSEFPRGNTVKGDAVRFTDDDVVLASKKRDQEGFLKSKKIEQGRALQIRMGYQNIPDNLPIIFTGRITEVELGDIIVIVAQGWKAELINRQVNFYSNNRKSWGPKDLVVQTVQEANPAGIGSVFAERDAEILYDNIQKLAVEDQIKTSAIVATDTNSSYGYDPISVKLGRVIGLDSLDIYDPDKLIPGIDTRLKNIWYPDISKNISNFLGWRRWGFNPDFINTYWIVPMQPAWNVLKEAERHTWNNVVQVVPYDSESTLFFGHPDQLYYYTKGKSSNVAAWKRYASKTFDRAKKELIDEVITPFILRDEEKTKLDTGPTIDTRSPGIGMFASSLSYLLNSSFKIAIASPRKRLVLADPSPAEMYEYVKDVFGGVSPADFIMYSLFGFSSRKMSTLWHEARSDLEVLIKSTIRDKKASAYLEQIVAGRQILARDLIDTSTLKIVDVTKMLAIRNIITDTRQNVAVGFTLEDMEKIAREIALNDLDDTRAGSIMKELLQQQYPTKSYDVFNALGQLIKAIEEYAEEKRRGRLSRDIPIIKGVDYSMTLGELLEYYAPDIKLYVYYLGKHLLEGGTNAAKVAKAAGDMSAAKQAPFMKTFRTHHYVDSDKDIIANNIVATTASMWNTVVINAPKDDPADTSVSDGTLLHRGTQLRSDVGWEYWPKMSQSKVIGLQFHPGLTLENKKIRVFTELNAVSEELKAKIACRHLADGIKKMYRGHLIIRGKNIRPYDRITIDDHYNDIKGTVEVESVVHSFSAETGWTTNIIPEAICDANPGAAIIQTALHEATMRKVYNVIDLATNALMIATVVTAIGPGLIGRGLAGLVKAPFAPLQTLKTVFGSGFKAVAGTAAKNGLNPMPLVANLVRTKGGVAVSLLNQYLYSEGLESIIHKVSSIHLMTAWSENASKVDQLPVIVSPMLHNGSPWTAGLEADDTLFSVPFYDTYYNLQDFKTAIRDYISITFNKDVVERNR